MNKTLTAVCESKQNSLFNTGSICLGYFYACMEILA
jgi:hypothetical protein